MKSSSDKQDFRSRGANDRRERIVFLGSGDLFERLVDSTELRELECIPVVGGRVTGI